MRVGVVDRVICTDAAQPVVLGAARHRGHRRAEMMRDLDGEMADAPTRAGDEHPLTRADLGRVGERLPGRHRRERQSCGGVIAKAVRGADEVDGRNDDVLRVRGSFVRKSSHAEHAVTHAETGHLSTDGLDRAGEVPAGGERHRDDAGRSHASAGAGRDVDRIHAGVRHADQHLVDPGDARRHVLDQLEDLRSAKTVLHDLPAHVACLSVIIWTAAASTGVETLSQDGTRGWPCEEHGFIPVWAAYRGQNCPLHRRHEVARLTGDRRGRARSRATTRTGGTAMTSTSEPGLVDVHAHFLTESYVQQATAAGHGHPDGMAGWPEWSPAEHLDLMERNGIAKAMLSMSSPGVHFGDDAAARLLAREVNEYAAKVSRDHPGRFGSFAAVPLPDVDGSLEEIAYAFDELDADGVALMTNAHGIYLGDERLEPVFAELSRRNAVVFLHPTSPPAWEQTSLGRPRAMLEYIFDTARTVTDLLLAGVLVRHPGLQVIVPHGGGALPVLADRIDEFARLFVGTPEPGSDVIEQLRQLHYDVAGTAFPRQVPALLELVDADRLLFGSDYCWTPPPAAGAHLAAIDAAAGPAPGTSWRALTTANAERMFPGRDV